MKSRYNVVIRSFKKLSMRLVVQGSAITSQHLAAITHLLPNYRGEQFTQVGQHAYYLPNQQEISLEVTHFCASEKIDCAYVENRHTLKNFGLA
ncbi:MAG: phosphoserine phosphatase SerB, partial [Nitrosomonadales bacterium]|nr:phosphoserine phosphatase SerB [Nitrosomonadales bacterium]